LGTPFPRVPAGNDPWIGARKERSGRRGSDREGKQGRRGGREDRTERGKRGRGQKISPHVKTD